MKTDREVELMRRERTRGMRQELDGGAQRDQRADAAQLRGRGFLPSDLKGPRSWRTRPNPFAEDWEWIVEELGAGRGASGQDLVRVAVRASTGRYQAGNAHPAASYCPLAPVRSRARGDVPPAVATGEYGQSDFTHAAALGVTIGGEPFPHLIYHLVLPYSNLEAVKMCFSESFGGAGRGLGDVPQGSAGCPGAIAPII